MGQFSLANLFGITIRESANDGSDFTNPDADYRRLFLGEDGLLHVKDSAGTVSDPFSAGASVATDSIWDAAGDLAVGTGANTAAKLTKGATGTVPTAGASTIAYAYPPGYQLDYVAFSAPVNVTHTTEGTSDVIVTGTSQAYANVLTKIEFFAPGVTAQSTAAAYVYILLYDGATILGIIGFHRTPAAAANSAPSYCVFYVTPTAATHQYIIKAMTSSGTGIVQAGAGGTGAFTNGFIRTSIG